MILSALLAVTSVRRLLKELFGIIGPYVSAPADWRQWHGLCSKALVNSRINSEGELWMEEIMTPSEVANLLKIHLKTVYKLAEKGVIPGNRIGRSWRFSRSDVLELVSSKPMNLSDSDNDDQVSRLAVAK
jgi:excisionase family DNA binding protein